MNGIINVFKPKGISSHGVVSRLRKILNMKRIGHTGTLDPNVTGVLPICIGKATRVSEYFLEADKEYIGEMTLGIKTDSQDSDGVVIAKSEIDIKKINDEKINNVFNNYRGILYQIPPMHSAVRLNGRRLYELAREGIEVERKKREINVYNLNIINRKDARIIFNIKCSKGTYVRTICNDIGDELGTYGYMSHLIRSGVGDFKIEDSISLERISELVNNEDYSFLLPTDIAVKNLNSIELNDDHFKDIVNGMRIEIVTSLPMENSYRIYCKDKFIGIGNIISLNDKKYVQMDKVLI